MIEKIIKSIFWDPSEKKIKELTNIIEQIRKSEEKFKNYSLEDIKIKTIEFKKMFEWLNFHNSTDSIKIREILESIKIDAFAIVKITCKLINNKTFDLSNWKTLIWNMIPYDVQLIWALAINDWNIAEMKTWEWKTLVATLPAYLNSLTWNPVHIVTVNDYLAQRDSEEMWVLYKSLWLKVWVVYNNQPKEEKQQSYLSDIVYATNNELWFDYLRDNMVNKNENKVQSKLFFAIIDEVDSILIDEARTPLIISMPDNEPTSKYLKFSVLSKQLKNTEDYKIDEKQKIVTLSENWIKKIENILKIDNIYVSKHYNDIHHIENALKAMAVYTKDKDYLVDNWNVLIIDEHTWRVLQWRRYSEWLHQAIEAKEWVEIQQESKTLASITFQNYFRMYWKLSWMTGTAKTEEEEFYKVYWLDTYVIPTNKPIKRLDKKDLLFKNEKWKFDYVVEYIKELYKKWQPMLVWTVSVEKSEYLSSRLKKEWVPHKVLNAKQHDKEAEVISTAWQKWAITIATNMAWRWTDIKLWKWVIELWWLIILWTEKHETRRIDNQLRWRAWRQWDPWMTQFLISPNDDIMRIFWGDKLFWIFNSPIFATLPDNEPLTQSSMLTWKVTWVQKQVEWHNFDIRKHILEYDDVINKHRSIIYQKRNKILDSENIDSDIHKMVQNQVFSFCDAELGKSDKEINKQKLKTKINDFLWFKLFNNKVPLEDDFELIEDKNELSQYISKIAIWELENLKEKSINIEEFYELERKIVLQSIDELWMRHIDAMSKLREEVAFEWYAQKNPLVVYKEKAFEKFSNLINELEYKVVKAIFSVKQISEIEEIKLKTSDFKVNNSELEWMLKNFNEIKQEKKKNNTNPLFVNPNNISNNNKSKIRV